ncbi:MAG: hypothetical protein DI570_16735 [Phenylobacterium zucineum]|nr:MAG: hypothetical protein DI570_16735 [Phenylobacterium zucineum]
MRSRPALFRLSVATLAASQILAACQRQPAPAPAEPKPTPGPTTPEVSPAPAVLDRARLLQALDTATSAYAAGQADAGENLASRRFVIRQAFGCRGPAASSTPGLPGWTWGKDHKTVEISLAPIDWTKGAVFDEMDTPWEAVEVFWIARPWARDAGCKTDAASPAPAEPKPAAKTIDPAKTMDNERTSTPAPATPVLPPPAADRQVAGLAAVFVQGGSRVGRRDGKPFAFTLRSEDGAPLQAPPGGYRLVLEGRLAAFPDGRAIRCRSASVDIRPVCIAAAEVDRVAFEDADGKVLREWRPG